MSTHCVEIIELESVEPHGNADAIEVASIRGWRCCVRKGQFKKGDRCIHIEPDYVVPLSHPAFSFLGKDGEKTHRVRARRLRGAISHGLVIPVPSELSGLPTGSNVMQALGIERWQPPEHFSTGGKYARGPSGLYCPKFDVENYQKYPNLFKAGEPVLAIEKMHGSSSRYVFAKSPDDGQFVQYVGSRVNWYQDDEQNVWWRAFHKYPGIGMWCQANPECVLYGEVFGNVQSLKYGAGKNDIFFAAFAVLYRNTWLDYRHWFPTVMHYSIPLPPLFYQGPFDAALIADLAEGDSRWPGASHMAEGLVVTPERERVDAEAGRVCLKMVSSRYLAS